MLWLLRLINIMKFGKKNLCGHSAATNVTIHGKRSPLAQRILRSTSRIERRTWAVQRDPHYIHTYHTFSFVQSDSKLRDS